MGSMSGLCSAVVPCQVAFGSQMASRVQLHIQRALCSLTQAAMWQQLHVLLQAGSFEAGRAREGQWGQGQDQHWKQEQEMS